MEKGTFILPALLSRSGDPFAFWGGACRQGALTTDEQAVMIWDVAGFHTSKSLRAPQNVTLLQLPAYSPELNPIESLRHYLKSRFWSNRTYAGYEALEAAAIAAWHRVVLNPALMQTVCAAKYLKSAC